MKRGEFLKMSLLTPLSMLFPKPKKETYWIRRSTFEYIHKCMVCEIDRYSVITYNYPPYTKRTLEIAISDLPNSWTIVPAQKFSFDKLPRIRIKNFH